jgi:hypothetical protein
MIGVQLITFRDYADKKGVEGKGMKEKNSTAKDWKTSIQ